MAPSGDGHFLLWAATPRGISHSGDAAIAKNHPACL